MADAKPKPKYKPFPKLPKKSCPPGRQKTDFEKLKNLYVYGSDFGWKEFCQRHGFNSESNITRWRTLYGIDFQDWRKEWLRVQAGLQDDEMAPEILDVRKVVVQRRVKVVRDWLRRSDYMNKIFDGMLRQHGDDLQWDMQNTLAIQAGKVQRRLKLTADEFHTIAGTALRLQDLEMKSILIHNSPDHKAILKDPDGEEPSTIPNEFNISMIGEVGLTANDQTKLLAQWFDQAEKKPEPEPAPPEEAKVVE